MYICMYSIFHSCLVLAKHVYDRSFFLFHVSLHFKYVKDFNGVLSDCIMCLSHYLPDNPDYMEILQGEKHLMCNVSLKSAHVSMLKSDGYTCKQLLLITVLFKTW